MPPRPSAPSAEPATAAPPGAQRRPAGELRPRLRVSLGHYSAAGRKPVNQDFHGAWIPEPPQLGSKGVALAIADGISSSEVSQIASEVAVTGFLQDYYCTSEAWSVRRSAQRVLSASNAWLHAQSRRSRYAGDRDRGYVCTFSALILKGTTGYLFHAGDTRIYRLRERQLEQLTEDHRLWVSRQHSYLARAMGVNAQLELDHRSLPLAVGDVFLLATDGVYEHLGAEQVIATLQACGEDLQTAARALVDRAYAQGSTDNLTVQLLRVEALPPADAAGTAQQLDELPLPPPLVPGMAFDGYRIVRQLHASNRSQLYLALDGDGRAVALKLPSTELRQDPAALERFLAEDWIARRLNNPHVLRPAPERPRRFLYSASEFIEGRTLRQWMIDHPRPELETVRGIVEQLAAGLRAFHRLEMLHQDLRPDNVMIDATGTVRIIDFGAVRVAGLQELAPAAPAQPPPGTLQFMAPEYLLGEEPGPAADLYSLGVIAYQMLSGGQLPYGTRAARAWSRSAQARLRYRPLAPRRPDLPAWIDPVLSKALAPDPRRRYQALSEFVHALRRPGRGFTARGPLIERNPVLFWQLACAGLAAGLVAALLS